MHNLSSLRRAARRYGLRLVSADRGSGRYRVVDLATNTVVAGGEHGWSLTDVAEHLTV